MKIAVWFLAAVAYTTTLPVEVPFHTPDKLDWSKLIPKNVYVEPINSTNPGRDELLGTRIIGGTEVAPNSVPYQVAVIIDNSGLCGGSLISTTCVLSAAHCTISASFVQVRLGAHYFNQDEATQVRITSTSIKNHHSYNPVGVANDISVIFLPSSVTINDHVQVIPLAAANAGTFEDSIGLVAGWGRTTDLSGPSPALNAVHIRIISNVECRNFYGGLITSSILCTSAVGPVGPCNGDSGGALVVDGVQVGVTSFGTSSCKEGNPNGFARITSFRAWIYENTGI